MVIFPVLTVSIVFSQKSCFSITRLVNELKQFHQRWTWVGIQPRDVNGSSTWLGYELKSICKQKQGLRDLSQFLSWSSQDTKCKRDESPCGWQRSENVLFPSHMIYLIPKYLLDSLSGFLSVLIVPKQHYILQNNVLKATCSYLRKTTQLRNLLNWIFSRNQVRSTIANHSDGRLIGIRSQRRAYQARPEHGVIHIQVSGTFIQMTLNSVNSPVLADLLCTFVLHACH